MKKNILTAALPALLFHACVSERPVVTPAKDNESSEVRVERKTYREAYPLINDLEHMRLSVRPDWQKKYLYGEATLTLHPHFYPTDSLLLNARGMDINEVSILSGDGKHL